MTSIMIEAGNFKAQRAFFRNGKLSISLSPLKLAVYELRSAVTKMDINQQIGKNIYFTFVLFDGTTIKGHATEKDYQLLYTEFRRGPLAGTSPFRVKSLLPVLILVLLFLSPVFYLFHIAKPGIKTGGSSFTLERTIVATNYGCKDEQEFDRIGRLHAQGDAGVAKRGLSQLIASGGCTIFNPEERVYIDGTAILQGKVKLRREGENDTYWTFVEAVGQ